ncbi:pentapeptide repeat protein [Scytonema sp. HK-05]|uniref:pentapeptide repeat-containing protein n=1 Tax=Scytonema sp. HK-05 TaxID=1137095 RepID=UPI0009378317|nr:pentapeptide repeat-containing protein [Scytonema sp. HK-05]OKH57434.1 hypothetical protein NIES2130_20155 [Scytonema sp. HK-05]BAY42464.1 pentapeptide repeat protein [Scytonema sp. HK-05]
MANNEYIRLLKQSAKDWNEWRRKNYSAVIDFKYADLSYADLSSADLSYADLSSANLSYANLISANLKQANLSRSDLSNADLTKANLTNANFKQANLSNADLSSLELSGLDFSQANLIGAKLIRTQVLGTDFTSAKFTGACLEDWNINSATKLDNIDCQYVYLRSDPQGRRPSSGEFNPGEFTDLFQKALETVDLIFRNGIDWKAFFFSFQELQAKNNEKSLSVQAIEKKSGGAFVIRLEVPSEANKAEIEAQAKALYEKKILEKEYHADLKAKDDQIIYRHQSANIMVVVEIMASTPIQNIIHVTNQAESNSMSESYQSKYDQRNSNTQFIDTAQLGSKPTFNQHNYTEEQRQNLADAAAEIQRLLNQLAQTNPTTTETAVAETIHQEIKRNPKLKVRLLDALKAGGLEALKQIFNHPLFSIPAETVRGWLEAE